MYSVKIHTCVYHIAYDVQADNESNYDPLQYFRHQIFFSFTSLIWVGLIYLNFMLKIFIFIWTKSCPSSQNFQSKSNSGWAERYLVQLWKKVLNCVEYRDYRCRHNSTQLIYSLLETELYFNDQVENLLEWILIATQLKKILKMDTAQVSPQKCNTKRWVDVY